MTHDAAIALGFVFALSGIGLALGWMLRGIWEGL